MNVKLPVRASDVTPEVWYENTDREISGRALCDVGGRAKIGVGLCDLPPGSNTKPAHYHTLEEEHLYAIEGSATLYLGDQRFILGPGKYVCFPASQQQPHYLQNDGDHTFRYLMIGERLDEDRVVYSRDTREPE
jgi:uncharacterized cupin superfamily protein